MNIVFVIHSLGDSSGTQRVACHLANLFVEQLNYSVTILNRDASFEQCAYDLNASVRVVALNGNYFNFYKKIQYYINTNNFDFLVAHNMGRLSLLCSMLSKKTIKIISLEHIAFGSRPYWVKMFSKIAYKKIDKVVCLTENDAKNYKDWFDNVLVIYNISPFFINYSSKKGERKIISVGRLTYQKNFQALLMAWKIIQDDVRDWVLEIYGDGEDLVELKTIIENNQLKNVYLMGKVKHIEDIYLNAQLFVMSSRYEGLPMVLIEAQTFGLPIIAFDCPYGPAEVIHHEEDGILVENQNVESLAQSMLALMCDSKRIQDYSLQALQNAIRFQQENILNDWKRLFEGVR